MRQYIAFAAFTLVIAGCAGDSLTGVSTSTSVDLSHALAQFSVPTAGTVASTLTGLPAVSAGIVPATCPYAAASKSFVCPATTVNGISVTSSFMLYDRAGTAEAAFDPASTASVRLLSSARGTVAAGVIGSMTVDQEQDLTMTGLLTSTHVLNGTSNLTASGTASALPVSMTSASTFSNLTFPATATAGGYPTSGSIIDDIGSTTAGVTLHSMVTLTFNGTSKVDVAFATAGRTQHCTIDAATLALGCG